MVRDQIVHQEEVGWFPAPESVNIWSRSLQGEVSSTPSPEPYFVRAQLGTSKAVTLPRQRPAPA
jgi:hypothetical protein